MFLTKNDLFASKIQKNHGINKKWHKTSKIPKIAKKQIKRVKIGGVFFYLKSGFFQSAGASLSFGGFNRET